MLILTVINLGGKEIFCDDVAEFAEKLSSADVAPVKVCKPLGAHDWILFDLVCLPSAYDPLPLELANISEHQSVPGVYVTKSIGPDSKRSWGL